MQTLENYLQSVIPGAGLEWQPVPDLEGLELLLLSPIHAEDQLATADIAKLWQGLPYWAFAWAGGVALSRYILKNPSCVEGKRILDFGCGSGISAIAAAKAGAKEVFCCDLDELALLAVARNAARNNVNVKTVTDWQSLPFDCLIAADVLYDLTSVPDLVTHCEKIPSWVVAETNFQSPPWQDIRRVSEMKASTWPRLDDFDDQVDVNIFCR